MASPSPEKRRKQRRTWPQRLTVVGVFVAAFACFVAAGVLAGGQWVLSQRKLAPLAETTTQGNGARSPGIVVPDLSTSAASDDTGTATATLPTLPSSTVVDQPLTLAEPDAANFLVVGADNGDCAGDPLIEDRSDLGERSDTIMGQVDVVRNHVEIAALIIVAVSLIPVAVEFVKHRKAAGTEDAEPVVSDT